MFICCLFILEMKIKVNRSLLPVKAHFFFFFAALGPILPQINVFGRQLGISPAVMGLVTAVLPLLWAAAKPLFGYVVDYWPAHRKLVFMLLIVTMSASYCGLWFIPSPEPKLTTGHLQNAFTLNSKVSVKQYDKTLDPIDEFQCYWSCKAQKKYNLYLTNSTFIETIYLDVIINTSCSFLHMDNDSSSNQIGGDLKCIPKANCTLYCSKIDELPLALNRTKRELKRNNLNEINETIKVSFNADLQIGKSYDELTNSSTKSDFVGTESVIVKSLYATAVFWAFAVLMCVGTVAFNVANCIGDAVCFDVLGPEKGSKYGSQRAWGTAGYGITALVGGWLVDFVSRGSSIKDFTPAFVLALVATALDLYSCTALNLPSLSSPDDSGKALRDVLKIPRVVLFIIFAVVAGMFDSFIIYYMFWFLEELAEKTNTMAQIKLIEGVVVAGQSFIGEIIFFALSGKIIKRCGYGATLSVSLCCYGVRMALISFITNPWHLVFIESIMQGPTYALCYSTIVGYAAHVAPEGYSATVQGIVAGMDDGVGFALGSLVGGQLYSYWGGRGSFRILAAVAVVSAAIHAALFKVLTRTKPPPIELQIPEGEKMLPFKASSAIYRDTVVPLTDKKSNRYGWNDNETNVSGHR